MANPRTLTILTSLAVALSAACHPHAPSDPAPDVDPTPTLADLLGGELVDLSYAYGPDTLYWPTSPSAFELQSLHHGPSEGGYFYSANVLSTPEHGGTHLDAPIHFADGQATTDQVELERLVAPAVVIDVANQAAADPDYRLTVADVESWEAEHGPVPQGSIVLLHTGWGKRWPDALAYLGDDTPGDASNLHFPSFGAEAADYLVTQRGAGVLGVDTASIDYGASTDFAVHRVASEAGVPGLENVANLDRVPPVGAWVIALPMKIAGGSGGPARIVALLPQE